MSKLRKTFAVLLAIALVVTMVTPAVFAQDEELVDRIYGENRYETSANIATKAFPNGADAVIVVNGTDDKQFADGLAASVLAGAIKAPILLTDGKGLHQKVVEAIKQLKASKAYVLGGTSAVSENVFNALKDLVGDVERISVPGGKREDTAAAIARKANTGSNTAYVVNGYRPSDAMVAGAAAFNNGNPILLVSADSVPQATLDALKDLGIENVIIVGGTAVVTQNVQDQLEAAGYEVKRLSGSRRAATALKFAQSEFDNITGFSIVNGGSVSSLSDAVGASVFGNPILFTEANSTFHSDVVNDIYALLTTVGGKVTLFGGTARLTADFENELKQKLEDALQDPEVDSVSVINPTTLQVQGKGLKNLKVENVSVEGNKVVAITPAADGKSATITLESKLAPNSDVKVTITVNGEKKEFTVNFEFKVTSVSIEPQIFDDDRAGQKVVFKVNGEPADIDYLLLAGYNVTFVAKEKDGSAANGFFDNDTSTNTSSTGIISTGVRVGEYTVEVQVTKAGEALVSDAATIKIVNLDAEATAINTVTFYSFGNDKNDDSNEAYDPASLGNDDYKLNSTTLVAGEKARVYKVEATVSGDKIIVPDTGFEVKSSNPAVLSVDSYGVLTAESAGNATVTIKVGEVTKTINFTVTNTARKLSKVTVEPSSVSMVVGYNRNVTVKTLDQYGDPFAVGTGDIDEVVPVVSGSPLVSIDVQTDMPGSIGVNTVTLTPAVSGSGTVYFKNASGQVLGSFYLNVSAVDNTGSLRLEIISNAPNSTDNILDLNADDSVTYQLSRYNTQGIYVEPVDLENYVIQVVDGKVATVEFDSSGTSTPGTGPNEEITGNSGDTSFTITGQSVGKTDILLKDENGSKVGQITITVVSDPITIKSVNFKSVATVDYVGATINYKNVLDIIESNDDDIVNGITLSKNTLHKVRIVENGTNAGILYLDVNGDAKYDTNDGDIPLGKLIVKATSDSTFAPLSTDAITGYTTSDSDKGTLLFKVLTDPNGSDETTAIAAIDVTVDVK